MPEAIDATIGPAGNAALIADTTPANVLFGDAGTCIVTGLPVPGSMVNVLLVRKPMVTLNVAPLPPPVVLTGLVGATV